MALVEDNVTKDEDIVDIDLSPIRKKKFRINGDRDKTLELNTSDMNIIPRLEESYPKLLELVDDASAKLTDSISVDTDGEDDEEVDLAPIADTLRSIDNEMRKWVDYIFDANVSDVCVENGSMYDIFNGKFRFEYIIDVISGLYEENLKKEFNNMSNRIKKHTGKYKK